MKLNVVSASTIFIMKIQEQSSYFLKSSCLVYLSYSIVGRLCVCLRYVLNIFIFCLVVSSTVDAKVPLELPTLERPKVQYRFQPREQRLSAYTHVGWHIRDDYYTSVGGGLNFEYFFTDRWGLSLQYTLLSTSLSDEALLLRKDYGLVPDASPQDAHYLIGGLWGLGYGKMNLFNQIMHFDPIFGLSTGIATAEARILPTFKLGFMPTFLLQYRLAIRLDLSLTIQAEQRNRGWIMTTGFMPMLSIGWGKVFWRQGKAK